MSALIQSWESDCIFEGSVEGSFRGRHGDEWRAEAGSLVTIKGEHFGNMAGSHDPNVGGPFKISRGGLPDMGYLNEKGRAQ